MALAPVIHDETLQLFVSVLILLPCTVISSVVPPWRAQLANLLDVFTNGNFVLVLFLGALFKNVDDKNVDSRLVVGDLHDPWVHVPHRGKQLHAHVLHEEAAQVLQVFRVSS